MPPDAPSFLPVSGEMARRVRDKDWSQTAVGAAETWPHSLKTIIRMMLTSRYAMWMGWGPDLTFFYNDAYQPTLGSKHPWALGPSAREVWREIWPQIGPRIEHVLTYGEATWDEALLLFLERHGFPEETYHTFSYSPLADDDGRTAGMLCVVTEDTQRVIGERRLSALSALSAAIAAARTPGEMAEKLGASLAVASRDMSFALIYLFDEAGGAPLLCATGIAPGHAAAPGAIDLSGNAGWPLGELLARPVPIVIDDLAARFRDLPSGPWQVPPTRALILPIAQQGQVRPAGALVAALNPHRPFDADYRGFLELVAGQIAAGLANARSYEAEHRRAEALAEIDRAKTTFFSNASHEFRTPLTLMLSPLEDMLLRSALAPSLLVDRREVELIHRNGLRLLKLVNTLLDFSRIEAGRIQAVYEPVDLAVLTAELASTFRSAMERAGLRFVVDCAPLSEPVYVDRDMWEKVVLNLLSNAFKYTLKGEIGVRQRVASDGRSIELSVSDTGVGIPGHELPHIFERFHRVEGQRGRTQEGTGIGLALVQELVKLHGGSVGVRSVAGEGTTFTVTVPIGRAHLQADRIGAERTQASTGLRADAFVEEALRWLPGAPPDADLTFEKELLGPERPMTELQDRPLVLLADDNADMRDYLRRLLATRYQVMAVEDGLAALDAAQRRRPDLVLTDVMMPRLDGFGLMQSLRDDAQLRDVPIIMLSARAGEEAKVEGIESGADDYLTKPFGARELLARVSTNLELARIRREAQEQLLKLNESLEQRVAFEIGERMKAEEILRQAQKMEAIGHLTGGVAHDFNNLLQVILGNLEGLKRRVAPTYGVASTADLGKLTDAAMRGAQRAAALTQKLLAFARKQPLEPKPIDPNRLVSGISDLLRRTLGETITMETVLAGGAWSIFCDPNQLESSILNLAINARDAMPNGGKLTVETANAYLDEAYAAAHEEVRPGQYVMISLTDTGIGMTAETRARAFDPFFTTKEVGQGTGLGLSQVYGFVKQSGGHVKIYSEPGEGTTVKLYLPRLHGERALSELPESTQAPRGRKGESILVVEDDEDVRTNTATILRELGYEVIEAADGNEALAKLAANADISLLFTDVGLPGALNGRKLAEAISQRRPDIKVLYTTGYARNAIIHHGRLDPGIELIVKPFGFMELASKIRRVLDA